MILPRRCEPLSGQTDCRVGTLARTRCARAGGAPYSAVSAPAPPPSPSGRHAGAAGPYGGADQAFLTVPALRSSPRGATSMQSKPRLTILGVEKPTGFARLLAASKSSA